MAFRFGDFCLDPVTGRLSGPDGDVPLRRQTFRLLEVLLERAPQLLDRDTLLDAAWGRTALSVNVLPQAISELRHALGDSAAEPRYIETLHRRGYRMACPVERVEPPAPTESARAQPAHDVPGDEPARSGGGRVQRYALAAAVLALVAISLLWWQQQRQQRWLDDQAVPEIRELMETDVTASWRLARDIRQRVGTDPQLEQLWRSLNLPVDLASEPPGAEVRVRGYGETDEDWVLLGRTPLEDAELPLAMMRFRVTLDGHAPIEAAPSVLPVAEAFHLHPAESAPEGMVYVPPGPVTYIEEQRDLPGFWIDRHEITNREYREFVAEGGYHRVDLWPEHMRLADRDIGPEAVAGTLVDATGMPGPSGWSMGTYPEGTGDHPVEGISFYEAAAYAEYAGKQLPTVFHWYRAAGLGTRQFQNFSDVLLASNFNGRGTVPVGSMDGLGHYGTQDMAGNVAEWCVNGAGGLRHILGGFWLEDTYRFRDPEARHPAERSSGFGLRLMRAEDDLSADLLADVGFPERRVTEPVDDATFAIYAGQFDYDPLPLDARTDAVDDAHPDWRREMVSFAAGYPEDRVIAHLFLPRNATPPYQTVVHYPGGDALLLDSSRNAGLHNLEGYLRDGRAVVYPVYLGTFERKLPDSGGPVSWRNLLVRQVKDLRRTLDYLETRPDFDSDRLVLHGISYGGFRAPYALAVEDRFRAAILISAGMSGREFAPEVRLQDYLPRIRVPVLLVSGRHDFNFPLESSQKPFFELLGSPDDHKRHLVLDWGHIPGHFSDAVRAGRVWMDRWLGVPQRPDA